jgi:hypothetical protein
MTRPRMFTILAAVALAGLVGAGLTWAQTSGSSMPGTMMGGSGMMGSQGTMMAQHGSMMQQAQELDSRLDGLVTAMNEAHGEKKIDAVAAVVDELVAERKALNHTMASMQPQMMSQMMQMMQSMPRGGMNGMGGSMHHGSMGGSRR